MEEKEMLGVPLVVFEGMQEKSERREKRNFIVTLILVILLVVTNFSWLIYESKFKNESTQTRTYTAESLDTGNAVISEFGDISINGESD